VTPNPRDVLSHRLKPAVPGSPRGSNPPQENVPKQSQHVGHPFVCGLHGGDDSIGAGSAHAPEDGSIVEEKPQELLHHVQQIPILRRSRSVGDLQRGGDGLDEALDGGIGDGLVVDLVTPVPEQLEERHVEVPPGDGAVPGADELAQPGLQGCLQGELVPFTAVRVRAGGSWKAHLTQGREGLATGPVKRSGQGDSTDRGITQAPEGDLDVLESYGVNHTASSSARSWPRRSRRSAVQVEQLGCHTLAGAHCALHVTMPLGGRLGSPPRDAPARLLEGEARCDPGAGKEMSGVAPPRPLLLAPVEDPKVFDMSRSGAEEINQGKEDLVVSPGGYDLSEPLGARRHGEARKRSSPTPSTTPSES